MVGTQPRPGWDSPLFARRFGAAGPAVVLLHGLGASGRSWRPVAERLVTSARVICPDLLGFGRSPWTAAAYSVTDHLQALPATLDGLGITEPLVLTGHSTGAMLALEWAAAQTVAAARKMSTTDADLATRPTITPPLCHLVSHLSCSLPFHESPE